MRKTKTFEDFIRNYLKNAEISSSKESYAAWVRKNGTDTDKAYKKSMFDGINDYSHAKSTYGKNAEALGRLGLKNSGYADYLNKKAKANLNSALQGAEIKKYESKEENVTDYIKRAEELEAINSKNQRNVIEALEAKGEIDFDRAYEYALDNGLDENSAKSVAKKATDTSRVKLKADILDLIVTERMSESQTKSYAKGLGLLDEEIEELAKIAKSINETVGSSYYTQYIKDLIEKQNNSSK